MSSKQIAMIFPGQGSQFVGMGKELACQYPEAAKVFAEADELLDYSISQLCFEGPEDKLRETRYTQPAIYVTSAAAYAVLRKEGIKPGIVAGHSLGAFSALYVSGAFDFATGLRLVQIRGKAMQKAAEIRAGTMAAINGLDDALLGANFIALFRSRDNHRIAHTPAGQRPLDGHLQVANLGGGSEFQPRPRQRRPV